MSEEKRGWRGFEWFVVLLLLVPASFLAGQQRGTRKALEEASQRVDTVTIVRIDTIARYYPVPVEKIITRTEYVPVTDTVRIRDTLLVAVPIEQVHYVDSLYQAWVSGYRPQLDSILVFPPTTIVEVTKTISEKPKKWGIGVTAGYGATVNRGAVELAPYLGIGISYNFLRW